MKTATVRELKHKTAAVLDCVENGQPVEIRKRGRPVAVLSPLKSRPTARPDFAARLRGIYGTKVLAKTATELLAEERGDR